MAGDRVRALRLACAAALLAFAPAGAQETRLFETADRCIGCHTGVVAPTGEDVSIGPGWRATMMANSSRDPYWQAAVRRETLDHPTARAHIEDECAICHMPLARTEAHAAGEEFALLSHLPWAGGATRMDVLAAEGVSCALCHQIQPDGLGSDASFTGRFVIDAATPFEQRSMFGPFDVDSGHATIMHSATGFRPTRGTHIQQSELCATCHTLITQALDAQGNPIGRLPEQVPFQEWRHSAYAQERSCQSCHMPVVSDSVPVSGVLGVRRAEVSRHDFRGGNAFMLRMLNRHRDELGVIATPGEFELAILRTERHLAEDAADLAIEDAGIVEGRLAFDVIVRNRTGHKLPTAYPSRRAWLNVRVQDAAGGVLFESGAQSPDGRIAGNDNDADALRYEPHYERIDSPDQVQIWEAILGAPDGAVTTGLLTANRFLKDNRLLPRGFDKGTAEPDVAVHGAAAADADFVGGGDRVRYDIALPAAASGMRVIVTLRFQPIGWRWANNLADYRSEETDRFVRFFSGMADASSSVLRSVETVVR